MVKPFAVFLVHFSSKIPRLLVLDFVVVVVALATLKLWCAQRNQRSS